MNLKEHIKKFDESLGEPLEESPKPFSYTPTNEKLSTFAPIEELKREIQDKDQIIENLKKDTIKLKKQVSITEKEKSEISEELRKSKWLENKITLATKKVYDDKVKSVINENVDSKLIHVLTAVARRKQGNQQLNWGNWLKIPENRYLYEVNKDIAKGVFEDTNNLIERKLDNKSIRGGSGADEVTTPTTIYGLQFDGLTNEVTTTFSGDGATPINRTYSFWMKSTHTARNYSVFGYGSNKRGTFTPNFSSGRVLMWNGNSWYTYWDDTSAQDDGDWHHWMLYDDVAAITGSKLYVDGTLQNVERNVTSGTVSNLLTYTQSLTIGAYKNNSTNTGHHFEGSISEFSVFSGDKTSNASTYYNNGIPYDVTNEDDLQGYWKMNEGSGTTVTDSSGEGNDGTIDGASWITMLEI